MTSPLRHTHGLFAFAATALPHTIQSWLWVAVAGGASLLPRPFGGLASLAVLGAFCAYHRLCWPATGRTRAQVRLRVPRTGRLWSLGVLVAFVAFCFGYAFVLARWLGPVAPEETSSILSRMSPVSACLVGPVIEEVVFRGWMLHRLAVRFGRAKAIFGGAFVFAAMHFNLPGFPLRMATGVVAGIAVYRTGSLWPAILLHVANNTLAMGLHHSTLDLEWLLRGQGFAVSVTALGAGLLALAWLCRRARRYIRTPA